MGPGVEGPAPDRTRRSSCEDGPVELSVGEPVLGAEPLVVEKAFVRFTPEGWTERQRVGLDEAGRYRQARVELEGEELTAEPRAAVLELLAEQRGLEVLDSGVPLLDAWGLGFDESLLGVTQALYVYAREAVVPLTARCGDEELEGRVTAFAEPSFGLLDCVPSPPGEEGTIEHEVWSRCPQLATGG